ncbi:MAG TPA: pyridoxal 5'-phosphate synthase glutaminase subunit PdxT [Capsulimonadaceae bacterium]|nr:pyridoxal 5'-phosphate synthase glutaminase subunit PdxT [Capsulimonadaceae bacterium]
MSTGGSKNREKKPRVAVVSLQGDFERHLARLAEIGAEGYEARLPAEIVSADAVILPGGESTTIGKLLARYELDKAIKNAHNQGKPIYGTCAGLILLARQIEQGTEERGGQNLLGLLDITVERNAFGRQVDSFESSIDAPTLVEKGGPPLSAVFIRAPIVTSMGSEVEALGRYNGKVVLVRQGKLLGSAFHPELTGDPRIHRYFLSLIGQE